MFQISYTEAGFQGILKEGGSDRREAVETAIKSLSGWLEAFYFSFGETDMIVIAELPDNVSAAAFSLYASSAGSTVVKTTVLITPTDIDLATRKTVYTKGPESN
jgi:uncharacterized protein with GYD domain